MYHQPSLWGLTRKKTSPEMDSDSSLHGQKISHGKILRTIKTNQTNDDQSHFRATQLTSLSHINFFMEVSICEGRWNVKMIQLVSMLCWVSHKQSQAFAKSYNSVHLCLSKYLARTVNGDTSLQRPVFFHLTWQYCTPSPSLDAILDGCMLPSNFLELHLLHLGPN